MYSYNTLGKPQPQSRRVVIQLRCMEEAIERTLGIASHQLCDTAIVQELVLPCLGLQAS